MSKVNPFFLFKKHKIAQNINMIMSYRIIRNIRFGFPFLPQNCKSLWGFPISRKECLSYVNETTSVFGEGHRDSVRQVRRKNRHDWRTGHFSHPVSGEGMGGRLQLLSLGSQPCITATEKGS